MHVAHKDRISRIRDLPVRDELKLLLTGQLDAGPFAEYFREPSYFYAQGSPDSPGEWPTFRDRMILPLWEHAEMIYAADLAGITMQVLCWHLECPDEYRTHSSIDAAIFDMIELHDWEYGGDKDEAIEAIHVAELVGLPHIDELRTLLGKFDTCSDDMIAKYRSRL